MIRLALRVPRAQAETVLAELLALVPEGLEERDLTAETVEYAIYGAPGELPSLPALRAAAGEGLVDISTSEIADDWSERWRSFHRPVLVEMGPGPRLHVRPPWEPARDLEGTIEIVIDPGQAFGTGAHHTTRLCLELLLLLFQEQPGGVPLVDLGTGSGVLAIAAAKLGYGPVLGLDNDPESIAAARENALENGVEVSVERGDLRGWTGPEAGEIVTANLLRPLLLELAGTMERAPAHLIVSGLLTEEAGEVVGAFERSLGLRLRCMRSSGEWSAAWLGAASEGESG